MIVAAELTRAVLLGITVAVVVVDAPAAFVYVLAGLVAIAYSAVRPAQAALLPTVARTPKELTAANVTSSTIESLGIFGGPAIGGVLLAVTSQEVVFGAAGLRFLLRRFSSAASGSRRSPNRARPETGRSRSSRPAS